MKRYTKEILQTTTTTTSIVALPNEVLKEILTFIFRSIIVDWDKPIRGERLETRRSQEVVAKRLFFLSHVCRPWSMVMREILRDHYQLIRPEIMDHLSECYAREDIRKLDFTFHMSNWLMAQVAPLVEKLKLNMESTVCDETLAQLTHCEKLDIWERPKCITNKGLASLTDLRTLSAVIDESRGIAWDTIKRLPSLNHLSLGFAEPIDRLEIEEGSMSRLTKLSLYGTPLFCECIEPKTLSTEIETDDEEGEEEWLEIDNANNIVDEDDDPHHESDSSESESQNVVTLINIDEEGGSGECCCTDLMQLSRLSNLRMLTLDHMVPLCNFNFFASLANLTALGSGRVIPPDVFTMLPQLRKLEISFKMDCHSLVPLTTLRFLVICYHLPKNLSLLTLLSSLQVITIDQVQSRKIHQVSHLTSLTFLTLHQCDAIKPEHLSPLTNLYSLRYFDCPTLYPDLIKVPFLESHRECKKFIKTYVFS